MSLLRSRVALACVALLTATAAAIALRDAPGEPAGFAASRRDLGDLIVLEVGGSYEEMGRQQAHLLGDDLRRVYAVQRQNHEAAVARGGFGDRVLDAVGIPLWSGIGGHVVPVRLGVHDSCRSPRCTPASSARRR